MTGIELKPCPFCGGEADFEQTGKYELTLRCVGHQPATGLRGCGPKYVQKVLPNRHRLEWLRERMTEVWNRRTNQPESGEAVAWAYFHPVVGGCVRFQRLAEGSRPDLQEVPLYASMPVTEQTPIVDAARKVLASWDERMHGEREQIKTGQVHYWSPSASMVDSSAIAELRAALSKVGDQ